MCRIFAELPESAYAYQTRSVRLGGHVTSIRLEASFWAILEEISAAQGVSLGRFLSRLHDEVLEFRGGETNFASLLRCACLTYASEVRGSADAVGALKSEAASAFTDEQAAPLGRMRA
ncbi:MAG: ribbon-helix-helix domain-containing protein [Rhizobiales bacterium]|nr:ribbon-helix-helix domain-containing protein [Hyphomicrobiales bacterium]